MANTTGSSHPNEREDIGARLKEAREYLGLSQQEVATALNLPRTAVSMMESGQRGVESLELKALAKLYQRPVAYFTGEDEEVVRVWVWVRTWPCWPSRSRSSPTKIGGNSFVLVSS